MITLNQLNELYVSLNTQTYESDAVIGFAKSGKTETAKVGEKTLEQRNISQITNEIDVSANKDFRQELYQALKTFGQPSSEYLKDLRAKLCLDDKGVATNDVALTKLEARTIINIAYAQAGNVNKQILASLCNDIKFPGNVSSLLCKTMLQQANHPLVRDFLCGNGNGKLQIFKIGAFALKVVGNKGPASREERLALAYLKGFTKGVSCDAVPLETDEKVLEEKELKEAGDNGTIAGGKQKEYLIKDCKTTALGGVLDDLCKKEVFEDKDIEGARSFLEKYIKDNIFSKTGSVGTKLPNESDVLASQDDLETVINDYKDKLTTVIKGYFSAENKEELVLLAKKTLTIRKAMDGIKLDDIMSVETNAKLDHVKAYKELFKQEVENLKNCSGKLWSELKELFPDKEFAGKTLPDKQKEVQQELGKLWGKFSKALGKSESRANVKHEAVKPTVTDIADGKSLKVNDVVAQSSGANTCYMMSIVNSLLGNGKGLALIKSCIKGDKYVFPNKVEVTKQEIDDVKAREAKHNKNSNFQGATDFEWAVHVAHLKALDSSVVSEKGNEDIGKDDTKQKPEQKPSEQTDNMMGKPMQMSDIAGIFGLECKSSAIKIAGDGNGKVVAKIDSWHAVNTRGDKMAIIKKGSDAGSHYMAVSGTFGNVGSEEFGYNVIDSLGNTGYVNAMDDNVEVFILELPADRKGS